MRKKPIKPNKNISFKEQRAKAMVDRRMRDRDTGGWAAEWSRKQGDHQHWSKMTKDDWMDSIYGKKNSRPVSS